MSKIRSIAIILGVVLFAIPSVARAQATPTAMKLLTRNTGWALMPGGLFWTTDFGQDWRKITPPLSPPGTEIAGVFFLNTSTGWALLRTSHSTSPDVVFGDWGFELAYTDNAGASWTVRPVQLPNLRKWGELGGGGSVDFVDASHGWVDFSLESSVAVDRGLLFSTDDGGATWRLVPKAPVIAAAVRFVTLRDGWMAGGPSGGDLYATHDTGKTWERVVLRSPLRVGRRAFSGYGLPTFRDPNHGAEVVSDPWGKWLTLFITGNGGRTWTVVGSLTDLPPVGTVPAVTVDSKLLAGWVTHRTKIALTAVGAQGRKRTTVGAIHVKGPRIPSVNALSFRDPETGWVIAGGRLYSTTDGGATWTDVTPKATAPMRHVILKPMKPHRAYSAPSVSERVLSPTVGTAATASAAGGGGGAAGTLHMSAHLGFDSSTAPLPDSMQTWWSYSPYYDYGFYLGGADTHYALTSQYGQGTQNPSITAPQWVSDIVGQGWGLIPFWVGPQAPYQTCTTGYNSYIDPATAQSQGTTEASRAVKAAGDLGLGKGTIIYYDMEYYDQTISTCQTAVVQFLQGWASGLQSAGYVPGLYTNTGPAEADWSALGSVIDDIMVGKHDKRATIWGLDCGPNGCTSGYGLLDTTWAEGYRAHQYFQYASTVPPGNATGGETYGGVALNCPGNCIDRDIEYAQVDGGSGFKTYSYCSTCFAHPDHNLGFFGINDAGMGQPNSGAWEVAGVNYNYRDPFPIDDVGGTVTELTLGYPGAAMGISNPRQVVGYAATAPGSCYQGGTAKGFYSYPPGQNIYLYKYGPGPPSPDEGCGPTFFSSINDDGMVAAYYYLTDATKGTFTTTGFVWDSSSREPSLVLAHSGWSDVTALGINGFGQIVGQYEDSRGNPHAFFEDEGVYTTISACKGSTTTDVWAINNNEQVVGICGATEFMYDLKNKKITTVYDSSAGGQTLPNCLSPGLDYSPSGNSCAWGINDAAQIVGLVSPAEGELWGFIATPVSTTQ